MNKNEPKRHHYIPQFILNNFCNAKKQLNYWNIKKKQLYKRNAKSVFMIFNMYRDEINHKDNPTIVEKRFARFEGEISQLIVKKIINKSSVVLTRAELEKIRIFLNLLSFRSDLRMNQYKKKNFDTRTRSFLSKHQDDDNFEDLWKKELYELAGCRSYKEINNNPSIDEAIKLEFLNGIQCFYMTIVDTDNCEFILSDINPTLEIFPIKENINFHLHEIFPISPTRAIFLHHVIFKAESKIENGLIKLMIARSKIRGNLLNEPQRKYKIGYGYFSPEDVFIYQPIVANCTDVEYINALILNEARNGIVFANANGVLQSIHKFNRREDTKTKYLELEDSCTEQLVQS